MDPGPWIISLFVCLCIVWAVALSICLSLHHFVHGSVYSFACRISCCSLLLIVCTVECPNLLESCDTVISLSQLSSTLPPCISDVKDGIWAGFIFHLLHSKK